MEIAGLVVAVVALIASAYSIHLQFFRKTEHLFLNVTWAGGRRKPGSFVAILTNGGDLSCVICGVSFSYTLAATGASREFWKPNAEVSFDQNRLHLRSGDHLPIVVQLPESLEPNRYSRTQCRVVDGREARFFPVVMDVEFVDSRGAKHLRTIEIGRQFFDSGAVSCGMEVMSQSKDLCSKT